MKQYIPENLDIDGLLLDYPPVFKYHRDHFVHILNLLTEIPARNKDLVNEDGWVPINAQTLQKRIRQYKDCLDYLVHCNVLERDPQYVPGQKSREYRFSAEYRTICKPVEIDKYTLTKNITTHKDGQKFAEKKYPYLAKYFNDDLSIDFSAASDYLYQTYEENCILGVRNPALKYNVAMMSAAKIRDHEFYFHVDQTVQRLHTNLTGCKSELRNFITYSGMNMVSIDLKNSQPWISTILLDPKFYEKNASSSLFFNIFNISSYSSSKSSFLPIPYIMLVKKEVSLDSVAKADAQLYREKVLNGTLYEYLADEINERHGIMFTDRKEIKKIIFTVLFSDNRFIGQQGAWAKKMFKVIFPSVYSVFAAIKRNNASALPILLQRMEARLMLDHVSATISKEYPDLPIFTIHDSIVCPVGMEQYVSTVITEESLKCIGAIPKLSFEQWGKEKVKKVA